LVEYITGMDTRIGYPNENLAGDSDESLSSPQYATAVGLLMNGLKKLEKDKVIQKDLKNKKGDEEEVEEKPQENKKSIFEKWTDKFKDFLDNAE
jgi:cell division protein FtsA